MKKLLIILFVGFFSLASAQEEKNVRSKIESARIGLITERLNLTPEQAEKFWPLYNEYRQKNNALKNEYQQAKRNMGESDPSEEQQRELLNLGLKLKERKVTLEKNYSQRMMNVISAQQLMSLRQAEEDFRRMLIEQIQKRRLQEGRRNRIRERIKDRRNDNDGN